MLRAPSAGGKSNGCAALSDPLSDCVLNCATIESVEAIEAVEDDAANTAPGLGD